MNVPQSFTFSFNGVKVKFPYENPYLAQKAIMANSIRACLNHENGLLESPTGTGKSLALLSSALAYQEYIGKNPIIPPVKRDPYKHHNDELIIDDIESIAEQIDVRASPSFITASEFLLQSQQSEMNSIQIPNPPDDMIKCNVVLKRHNIPIWYTSRTHSQLKQIVSELKKLDYHPQMTILSSRKRICLYPPVAQSSDPDGNCQDAIAKKKCPYSFKKEIPPELRPYGKLEKFDSEELIQFCRHRMICPYLLSRFMMKSADLVLCPYNFIMNPKVKGQMMLSILGVVLIIDEAHNIESMIKESTSFDHERRAIQCSVRCMNQYLASQNDNDFQENGIIVRDLLSGYLRYINDKSLWLRETRSFEYCETNNVELFNTVGITKLTWPKIRLALDYIFVVGNGGRLPSVGTPQNISMAVLTYLEQFYVAAALCFKNNCRFMNAFKFVLTLGNTPEEDHLSAITMDSGAYFSTVADEVNTVILSSGTLSPINQMSVELGVPFKVQLSASHVISPKQLEIYTVGKSLDGTELLGTYKTMEGNRKKIELELGQLLLSILKCIPGGVLFFMPSHGSLSSMLNTWQRFYILDKIRQIKPIFFEEPSLNSEMYEEYKMAVEKEGGALLMGVCRGRMSEGIDFYDEQARCVILFSIPYPPRNDRDIALKIEYNNRRAEELSLRGQNTGMSGSEWYDAQAYRALFQATGRCIRHSQDYGSIILIDSRFSKQINRFPRWMQQSFVSPEHDTPPNELPGKLERFYKEMELEFPQRVVLKLSQPTTLCCAKCGMPIVDIESLENDKIDVIRVDNRPGLHEICQKNMEDGDVFVKKDAVKHFYRDVQQGKIKYSSADVSGYQPLTCKCGEILGAIFKVGKLQDVDKLDGIYLGLAKVVASQGKVIAPITSTIELKKRYTIRPQGKGQQILCLTLQGE